MQRWLKRLLMAGIAVVAVYLGVGFGLALFSQTAERDPQAIDLSFTEVLSDPKGKLAELKEYEAGDGTKLNYRRYAADPEVDTVMVLIHGSAYHSEYLQPLAATISAENAAHVYTPDLRGHGEQVIRRGDVDYIGQLEDDLADFLSYVRQEHGDARLVLAGHSSGGGLVIRFAGGDHEAAVDGYVLLAPYIHHSAPTNQSVDSGWASPNVPRIIGLDMLNKVGITALNHLSVIRFNMPEIARDGTETLVYSYRVQKSMHPRNQYIRDLAGLEKPVLVLVGRDDETFVAEEYRPLFAEHARDVEVAVLDGVNHMGVVTNALASEKIVDWLSELKGEAGR